MFRYVLIDADGTVSVWSGDTAELAARRFEANFGKDEGSIVGAYLVPYDKEPNIKNELKLKE